MVSLALFTFHSPVLEITQQIPIDADSESFKIHPSEYKERKSMSTYGALFLARCNRVARVLICIGGFACNFALAGPAEVVTGLAVQSQRIAKSVLLIDRGRAEGFTELRDSRGVFSATLHILVSGGSVDGCVIAAPSRQQQTLLEPIVARWVALDRNLLVLDSIESKLMQVKSAAKDIHDQERLITLLAVEVSALKMASRAPSTEINSANYLVLLPTRMTKNLNFILNAEMPDPEAAFQFFKDKNNFNDISNGLLTGSKPLRLSPAHDEVATKLAELIKKSESVRAAVDTIQANLKEVVAEKQVTQFVLANSESMYQDLQRTHQAYLSSDNGCVQSSPLEQLRNLF